MKTLLLRNSLLTSSAVFAAVVTHASAATYFWDADGAGSAAIGGTFEMNLASTSSYDQLKGSGAGTFVSLLGGLGLLVLFRRWRRN
jgi:hypothetical protein